MSDGARPLRWAWTGALACFALAGLTGSGFRWALAHVAAARDAWGASATCGRAVLAAAVAALLFSLVPISSAWPAAGGGRWAYVLAAVLALGPVLVALRMLASPRPEPS